MSQPQPSSLSDEEILSGCRKGQSSSWQAFVERFSGLVHWSVWKFSDHLPANEREDLSREVFQDFFIRMMEKGSLEQLQDHTKLRKFIVVTVTHMTQNKLRSMRRSEARFLSMEDDPSSGEWRAEIADETQENKLLMVASAVDDLAPREKAILDLCYGEGMTHADIAILLGMSQDTVSTVIRRSKEKIKKKLLDHGF